MRISLVLCLFAAACTSASSPRGGQIIAPVKPIVSAPALPAISTPPNSTPLVASVPSSAPSSAPLERPDPDTTLALGNGTDVVVALDNAEAPEKVELALELRKDNKVVLRRDGWDAITHFDRKKLSYCETWFARIGRAPLGEIDAVRVSLVCRTGEDYLTSEEVAVFVKPDSLETIWAGLADGFNNSMDSCIEARHVDFRIIPPKTLEKTIVEETHWVEQTFDESLKARLRRDCKIGKKRSVERIQLP